MCTPELELKCTPPVKFDVSVHVAKLVFKNLAAILRFCGFGQRGEKLESPTHLILHKPCSNISRIIHSFDVILGPHVNLEKKEKKKPALHVTIPT